MSLVEKKPGSRDGRAFTSRRRRPPTIFAAAEGPRVMSLVVSSPRCRAGCRTPVAKPNPFIRPSIAVLAIAGRGRPARPVRPFTCGNDADSTPR